MDHTYTDEKNLKTLEDLAVYLTAGLMTLVTLHNAQVRAVKLGIMKEDQNERANTIAWDLNRLGRLYQAQLESVLELLPPEFDAKNTIERLKRAEITKARAIIRKPKIKEETNISI